MKYKHGGNIKEVSERLKIEEDELIDFSANINPLGYPEEIKDIVNKSIEQLINYPDPNYDNLKRSISENIGVKMHEIIVGNGGIDLIHKGIEAIKPKNSLIVAPTFVEYEKALKRIDSKVVYFILNEKEAFELNLDKLKSMDYSNIDLVIICNPNNPTGYLIDKNKMVNYLGFLEKNGCKLLVDESFIDFIGEAYSLKDKINKYDNLIIIRSLTKFYAIPGLRLGFALTSNTEIINFIKTYSESWNVNLIADEVGQKILENEVYINKTKKYIKKEKDYLFKELSKFRMLKVYPSVANFIFFKCSKELNLKYELLNDKILIRNCSNYVGLNKEFYRIAVRRRDENNKLIERLKDILEVKKNEFDN